MFNTGQEKLIKIFASVTNINNNCFKKCVFVEKGEIDNNLKLEEIECLKKCAFEYIELRDFYQIQLLRDFESIKKKNRKIFDDET